MVGKKKKKSKIHSNNVDKYNPATLSIVKCGTLHKMSISAPKAKPDKQKSKEHTRLLAMLS